MNAATIGDALAWTAGCLERAGVEGIRLESRLLVAHALGKSPEYVFSHPELALDEPARHKLGEVVERRAGREPMAHITGEREFWSLPFAVSADTLIPRPDSETLIEAVLDAFPDPQSSQRVLDLGTGSGCLMLALLHERKHWTGVGLDRSAPALDVARANATALCLAGRCDFAAHDWSEENLGDLNLGFFDLVIANPPYIPENDRSSLEPEVAEYEPSGALFAGVEGLDDYTIIVPLIAAVLAPGGRVFLEIGKEQADPVTAILLKHGFNGVGTRRDLSGIPRCLFAGIEKP